MMRRCSKVTQERRLVVAAGSGNIIYFLASPALIAFSAFLRQSGTALVQLSAALRFGVSILISSLSMMHGGTASEHFFKQTLAAALPQRMSYTFEAQHAFSEACPRTFLHVG